MIDDRPTVRSVIRGPFSYVITHYFENDSEWVRVEEFFATKRQNIWEYSCLDKAAAMRIGDQVILNRRARRAEVEATL